MNTGQVSADFIRIADPLTRGQPGGRFKGLGVWGALTAIGFGAVLLLVGGQTRLVARVFFPGQESVEAFGISLLVSIGFGVVGLVSILAGVTRVIGLAAVDRLERIRASAEVTEATSEAVLFRRVIVDLSGLLLARDSLPAEVRHKLLEMDFEVVPEEERVIDQRGNRREQTPNPI